MAGRKSIKKTSGRFSSQSTFESMTNSRFTAKSRSISKFLEDVIKAYNVRASCGSITRWSPARTFATRSKRQAIRRKPDGVALSSGRIIFFAASSPWLTCSVACGKNRAVSSVICAGVESLDQCLIERFASRRWCSLDDLLKWSVRRPRRATMTPVVRRLLPRISLIHQSATAHATNQPLANDVTQRIGQSLANLLFLVLGEHS